MRYAIIADIHSNLIAFQSVLADVQTKGGFDQIWCLGDMVGYGPEPTGCIALLRQHNHLCIAGNHDWAAVGKITTSDFNAVAAQAAYWTSQQLSPDDKMYLENLPLTLRQGEFTLAHGSPREPIWEYLLSTRSAAENLNYFQTPYCLIGHSHVPMVFDCSGPAPECDLRTLSPEDVVSLDTHRLIMNPGSVGQPRDGDSRASYAVYDDRAKQVYHYRVEYDIALTQEKMRQVNLPPPLITRLSRGM